MSGVPDSVEKTTLKQRPTIGYQLPSSQFPSPVTAGVTFQLSKVERVQHQDGSSHVECSDGTQIQGRMVLDATGHARKLVEYDKPFDPGYQVPDFLPSHLYYRSRCRAYMSLSASKLVCSEGHRRAVQTNKWQLEHA